MTPTPCPACSVRVTQDDLGLFAQHRTADGHPCPAVTHQHRVAVVERLCVSRGIPASSAERMRERLKWSQRFPVVDVEDTAHVHAFERHLLTRCHFRVDRGGWFRRGNGPAMSRAEAVARIRRGQFDRKAS